MTRIFPAYAYSGKPRAQCWWQETAETPQSHLAQGSIHCDVAIIGAGFTGLNAALGLAKAGVSVAVFDGNYPGWGASGRNGGFCCLGGGALDNPMLERRFGREGRRDFRQTEKAAIEYVSTLLSQEQIDVDRHSDGETALAHRASDLAGLHKKLESDAQDYDVASTFHSASELEDQGLSGPFHGALTTPIGFALNPQKYVTGLVQASRAAGATIFAPANVTSLVPTSGGFHLAGSEFDVTCQKVIIATNGYSSETVPEWMGARYMPSQSSVLVTRPLTDAEIQRQGWTSDQMAYDTRNLLHYFRLMPDRRFLFGMRGGLLSSPRAETRARLLTRAHFEKMFPAWQTVETTHSWSGMVCLARNLLPYVGPIPGYDGAFTALAYHGNGVAMGSYAGAILANLVQDRSPDGPYPAALRQPLAKFPLGRFRRALMPPIYAAFGLADR